MAGLAGLIVTVALAGCASAAPPAAPAPHAAPLLHWSRFRHLTGVVDFAGPAADGSVTVAAGRSLFILSKSGVPSPFTSASASE